MGEGEECVFCKIIAKTIPAAIVFEDDEVIAFKDIRAKAPIHLLLVPKVHIKDLNAMLVSHEGLLGRMQLRLAALAKEHNIDESGYKVVTNIGNDGGQVIHHLHYHLLGGAPVNAIV